MKFLQHVLATPALFGLLVPMTASASEINFDEINNYVQNKSSSKKRFNSKTFANQEFTTTNNVINSIKEPINEFEAGSFSETTTMSGSASFQVGAVDGSDITEAVTATYSYDIDLNTSFKGDDNLYVGIETGNSSTSVDFALDSSGDGADSLSVTSMYYEFPLGEYEIAVGPKLDSDDLMPTTTSTYSDSFFFGSQYGLASNYFASQGTGAGVAVARTFDGGFNASASIIGTGASTSSGILTKEGIDIYTLSLGYDADNYGGGIVFQSSDSVCTLAGNYATSLCNDYGISAILDEGYSTTTYGAFYSPGEKTTLSATSSIIDASVKGASVDKITDYQLAIDKELGDGILSVSWKTFPFFKVPDLNGTEIMGDVLGSFLEVYYTYHVNDFFVITPGFATAMQSQNAADLVAEGNDLAFYLVDRTAIGVGATFKF